MFLIVVADVNPGSQLNFAGIHSFNTVKDLENSGFAGSVVAYDGNVLALFDAEIKSGEQMLIAKGLGKTCYLQHIIAAFAIRLKGYFHTVENRIALQEGMSEIQTVKTLVHEMAHQKLHSHEKEKPREERLSARSKEVEAESVAYTVCQHFGIDTSEYSFGYIAGWSSDRETEELKESLGKIRNAASEMITEIEEKLTEMSRAEDLEKIPETLEELAQKSPSPMKGNRASVLETLAETRKLAEKAKTEEKTTGEKSPRRKEEEVL